MKIELDLTAAEANELRDIIRSAAGRSIPGAVKLWKAIALGNKLDTAAAVRAWNQSRYNEGECHER